jgi:hypothetical protein
LVAGLQNFDQAINATNSALDSAGSAQNEFETAMGGLTKKIEGLKGAFQELVWGEGGLNSFLKILIDLGTGTLKLINNLGGLPTILMSIASAILLIKGTKIYKSVKDFFKSIPSFITSFKKLSFAISSGTATITTANQAMTLSIPIIGAIVTAITAVIAITNAVNSANEERIAQIKELVSANNDEIKSLNTLKESLTSESLTREELISLVSGSSNSTIASYKEEVEAINDVNEARQLIIDKIDEEKRARAQETIDTGLTQYEKYIKELTQMSSNIDIVSDSFSNTFRLVYDSFSSDKFKPISFLKDYQALKDIFQKLETGFTSGKGKYTVLKEYKEDLIALRNEVEEGSDVYESYTENITNVEAQLVSLSAEQEEASSFVTKYNNALVALGLEENITYNTTEILTKSQEENINVTENQIKSLEDLEEIYDNLTKTTSSLISEADSLSSAFSEQEENGKLSAKTIMELVDLGYASALSFDNETKSLKLNQQAVIELTQAKLELQIAELKAQRAMLVTTDFIDFDLNKWKDYTVQIQTLRGIIEELPNALASSNGGSKSSSSSKTTNTLSDAQKEWEKIFDYINDAIDETISNLQTKKEEVLNNLVIQAQKVAGVYEEERNEIEQVIDTIKERYSEEKQALKDKLSNLKKTYLEEKTKIIDLKEEAKEKFDEELNSINEQILALKEQKYYEEELAKLEQERSDIQSYWQTQIDAINATNDSLNDQIALREKLEALEKAKSEQILVLGTSDEFEYTSNEEAIAKAQEEYDNLKREQDAKSEISRLTSLMNNALAIQDAKIQAFKDSFEETLDDQILALQEQQVELKKEYETEISLLDEQLAEKKAKYKEDTQALKTEMANIKAEYKQQVSDLKEINKEYEEASGTYDKQIEDITNYKIELTTLTSSYSTEQTKLLVLQQTGINTEENNWITRLNNLSSFVQQYNNILSQLNTGSILDANTNLTTNVEAHASGSSYIPNDQMALVGDKPNQELVIGSKLNGSLMNLAKGSGVVNAKSTNTLAGLLNSLPNSSNLIERDVSNTIIIQNLNLPQVTNSQDFVNYFKNFKNKALQMSFNN